jgi:hypothetical protein
VGSWDEERILSKKFQISGENKKGHQLEIFRHLSCIIRFSTGKKHGDYFGILIKI